ERPAHFVANDDSAHRRRDHLLHLAAQLARQLLGQREGEPPGPLRIHQYARALQVERAVAPGRKLEMAFEQGVAGAELGENLVFGHAGEAPLDCLARRAGTAPPSPCRACRKISLEALEAWGKRAYRPGQTGPTRGRTADRAPR